MKGWMKSLCPQPTAWTETEKTYPHPKERTGPYRLFIVYQKTKCMSGSICMVTPAIGLSPHLASPVGEGQILSVV